MLRSFGPYNYYNDNKLYNIRIVGKVLAIVISLKLLLNLLTLATWPIWSNVAFPPNSSKMALIFSVTASWSISPGFLNGNLTCGRVAAATSPSDASLETFGERSGVVDFKSASFSDTSVSSGGRRRTLLLILLQRPENKIS